MKVNKEKRYGESRGFLRAGALEDEEEERGGFIVILILHARLKMKTQEMFLIHLICGLWGYEWEVCGNGTGACVGVGGWINIGSIGWTFGSEK